MATCSIDDCPNYGVGLMTVSRIKNRKTWNWLIGGSR